MLCYVIWLFVKRLSQEAIQRRSQRDRLVKIKVFKLRRDANGIPCNITLRSAGGESFHSAGHTTAKARFWDREVRDCTEIRVLYCADDNLLYSKHTFRAWWPAVLRKWPCILRGTCKAVSSDG